LKIAIIANGAIEDYAYAKEIAQSRDYLIACDGGAVHALKVEIVPDLIIGDMDSAPKEAIDELLRHGSKQIIFPEEKDDTDFALAMERALSMNPSSICVLGALGGRFDHALANVHVLIAAAKRGVPAEIIGEACAMQIIESEAEIEKSRYENISLIPISNEVTGITTRGLKYKLNGETLRIGTTRGVSNRFEGETASVKIESGLLLAVRWG